MADTGTAKSKTDNLDAKEEQRVEERHIAERNEEQDLNQGMDTGTHDSTRHGVAWGPSYRVRTEIEQAFPTKKQIEARAYELYLQRGCEAGRDTEDWLIAEKELKQR